MKAVIQRVKSASVTVDGAVVGEIGTGLLTLLAIEKEDQEIDVKKLCDKIVNFRVFEDNAGKMNLSLVDIGGQHLVVSQFTLAADCNRGRRPSFEHAAPPEKAEKFYLDFVECSKGAGIETAEGKFQADMKVELVNDGPVTFHFSR